MGHQIVDCEIGVIDQRDTGVDYLGQIVRRDICRHADRDAGRAVDQQRRHPRRHDRRFTLGLVIVRCEIDGFLVEIRDQLVGYASHAHFGVSHRRRSVSIDRAEIALAIDKHVTHRERLCHTHDSVVYRGITVRVVLADHVTHHARRLLVRFVVVVTQLPHRVQDTSMNGFETVPDIGERPADNYAHGVIQVGLFHLAFETYGYDFAYDFCH